MRSRSDKRDVPPKDAPFTRDDLYDAIMEGAVERVRPKMMTVAAIMAGLLPIMWSHGAGAEVMQRIAVPMIGGMVSSTVLTLVVIPAIYAMVKGIGLRRRASRNQPLTVKEVGLLNVRYGSVQTSALGHYSAAACARFALPLRLRSMTCLRYCPV